MQPRDLDDGEFEIGLDCCEIDLLRIGTRPGEAMVIVWHARGMPDDGCSMVNAAKCAARRPSRYGENRVVRRSSLIYGRKALAEPKFPGLGPRGQNLRA
jgi:hypothetical protein